MHRTRLFLASCCLSVACGRTAYLEAPETPGTRMTLCRSSSAAIQTVAALEDQPVALSVVGDELYVSTLFSLGELPTVGGSLRSVSALTMGAYFENHLLIADASHLYWDEGSRGGDTVNAIVREGLDGSNRALLANPKGYVAGLALDEVRLYWVNQDEGTVNSIPLGGGVPTVLAEGVQGAGGLTLQNGTLYLMSAGRGLLSVPTGGGSPTVLVPSQPLPPNVSVRAWIPALTSDAQNVYFSVCSFNSQGVSTVSRFSIAEGSVSSLAQSCASGIAIDDSNVYWASARESTVNEVPRAGGAMKVLATNQNLPGGPALDDCHVYWTTERDSLQTCGLCRGGQVGTNAVVSTGK
jgi:hypothetical protein